LGGSVHTVKENAEALVVATKEIGLEVNADKTKYMVHGHLSRSACRKKSQYEVDNSSFERVQEFKYLETTLTNQNFIQE
jgi:UDP-2,3-diacylglucosamine pyrophosphatase LpxH